MTRKQNEHRRPGSAPVLFRSHATARPIVRLAGMATVLGSAAILTLAHTMHVKAQTATTEQTQPPATAVEKLDDRSADHANDRSDEAAASDVAKPIPMEGQIVEQPEGTFQVSELIGATVASPQGETIGEVVDLLYAEDGGLTAFVIGIGGFLGFGEKEIAMAASEAMRSTSPDGEQQVVINFTLEQLEQAPEFLSLDDQRLAKEEEEARQALEATPRSAEQAQQPATTVPTQ